MNGPIRDDVAAARCDSAATIRRRHLIYVCGYDPRGAQGYFELFRRTCQRFERLWPQRLALQRLEGDSADFAHWRVTLRGADWQVATQYDFLRLGRFIRADMQDPTAQQVRRALGWCLGDVFSGAQFRIFRASWRFGLHLLLFQLLALAWVAVPAAIASALGVAAVHDLGWPIAAAAAGALVCAIVLVAALRPLAARWRVIQISNSWTTLRRFGCGRPTWIDAAVEAGARHVVAVARNNAADELVVVGHSSGGVIASAIMARALVLDPDLGRRGPRLVLLTLGSVMPAVALAPAAQPMRDIVGRLAGADTLAWIDCQSRKDVMCFANFDPVAGSNIDLGARRYNPIVWQINFKEAIAPENYDRFRRNFFRVHYQYIVAGDRPAPYDYVLLVAGPRPIEQWPTRDREFSAAMLEDAASAEARHPDAVGIAP